jgi:hypothetical protein
MSRLGVTFVALVLLTDISKECRSLGSSCSSISGLGSASTRAHTHTLSIALRESLAVTRRTR